MALLWPGFVYISVRSRTQPDRPLSPLRETVTIASVSLITLAAVAGVFGLLRVLMPAQTPAIGQLVVRPRSYVQTHYVSLAWWITGLMALAIAGAALAATLRSARGLLRVPGLRYLVAGNPHPSQVSSWWLAFTEYPTSEYDIYVGCVLDNGSYVTGIVYAYPQSATDAPDRDLVIRAPISVRPPGGTVLAPLAEAGLMTISAQHIVTMTVSYVPRATQLAPAQAPASPQPTSQPASTTTGVT
jgi:hypothetical protein